MSQKLQLLVVCLKRIFARLHIAFSLSLTPHARERVPDVRRRSRGSATLPRHMRGNAFRTCDAGRAGAQPYRATRVGTCPGRATPVAQERNPTAPHAWGRVPDVRRRSRGSATLPRHTRGDVSRACNAGRAGGNPTASHAWGRVPGVQRRSPVAQPYRVTCAGTRSGRATPVARERNPTASHAWGRVSDVQRRSRSATLSRHTRGNVSRTCDAGARDLLPSRPGPLIVLAFLNLKFQASV